MRASKIGSNPVGRVGRLKRKLFGKEGVKSIMPCVSCIPDPNRVFDCNCGTYDSYCVDCGKYMVCEKCDEA